MQKPSTSNAWSTEEVRLTVQSYLDMLTQELAGQSYNKSACRKLLFDQMGGARSEASIEFKHGNVSAVMRLLGFPYIKGYQPRPNFQAALVQEVEVQIRRRPALDAIVQAAVQQPAAIPLTPVFNDVEQAAPKRRHTAQEPVKAYELHSPAKRDYVAQEARNQSLGIAGEQFIVLYERWKLQQSGLHDLASKVEHVSETLGDGLGFDVRSFDRFGKEKLIEVKTTSFAKETPFFVTRNELAVSRENSPNFHLYRLYDFRSRPQMFDLPGAIDQHCALDATTYMASFS